MRNTLWLLPLVLVLMSATGCKPDLVVSEFTVGPVGTTAEGGTVYWSTPVTLVVTNDSDYASSTAWIRTKAGLQGDPDHGMYGWQFSNAEFDKVYRLPSGALSAHQSVTFSGTMFIGECVPARVGHRIDLWAVVDPPTAGDLDGDVSESNESNNSAPVVTRRMPAC